MYYICNQDGTVAYGSRKLSFNMIESLTYIVAQYTFSMFINFK